MGLAVVLILQRQGGPPVRIPDLERRVHELTNKQREKNKAGVLRLDEELSRIARGHSADMARRRFFAHVNPDGKDATARGKRAGYVCRKVDGTSFTEGLAENIYQGSLYSSIRITGTSQAYDWYSFDDLAEEPVKGWMNSPGHRRNILDRNFGGEGIGIAIDDQGKVLVTQVFC